MKDLVQGKMGKSLDPVCVISVYVLLELINMMKYAWHLVILSNSVNNVNYLLLSFLEAQSQISN